MDDKQQAISQKPTTGTLLFYYYTFEFNPFKYSEQRPKVQYLYTFEALAAIFR